MKRNIIVIGHVDHGKTTFVKALDRLLSGVSKYPFGTEAESYNAEYKIGENEYFVFDYAGHADYEENLGKMEEWAAILVCAATDGPMPETRKHIELCREKGIDRIAVFFSKCDMVEDDELIDLIEWDMDELLEEYDYPSDCPKLRASAEKALDWGREEDKKVFFRFLGEIHRME